MAVTYLAVNHCSAVSMRKEAAVLTFFLVTIGGADVGVDLEDLSINGVERGIFSHEEWQFGLFQG